MFLGKPLNVRRVRAAIADRPSLPVGAIPFDQRVKYRKLIKRRSLIPLECIEVGVSSETLPYLAQGIELQLIDPVAIDVSLLVQRLSSSSQTAKIALDPFDSGDTLDAEIQRISITAAGWRIRA